MRYLKKFEDRFNERDDLDTPKFNIGDIVKRTKLYGEPLIYYIVDGYDYRNRDSNIKDMCRLKKYEDKDKLANKEGFYTWVHEDSLTLASEEEATANKYNL